MSAAVEKSNLAEFIGKGLKVLWFQNSVIAIVLAIVFAIVAIRVSTTPKGIIVVLALFPLATAAFVYYFIGNFMGGHVFLAAGIAAMMGGPVIGRKHTESTEWIKSKSKFPNHSDNFVHSVYFLPAS